MSFHSRFEDQKAKIKEFNATNKWTKRGISILPVKFGIAFTALHLNQVPFLLFSSIATLQLTLFIPHGGIVFYSAAMEYLVLFFCRRYEIFGTIPYFALGAQVTPPLIIDFRFFLVIAPAEALILRGPY